MTPPRANKEIEEPMMSGALDPEDSPPTPLQTPVIHPEDAPVIRSVNVKGKGKVVVPDPYRLERFGLVPHRRRPSEGVEFDIVGGVDESEKGDLSLRPVTTRTVSECSEMAPLERCPKHRGWSWDSGDSGIYLDGDESVGET